MKKLDGFTNIFLPFVFALLTIGIIQGVLTSSFFESIIGSIIQVIVFPVLNFLYTSWQGKKYHTRLYGKPSSSGEQKVYSTSAFTYFIAGLTFIAALVAVLF